MAHTATGALKSTPEAQQESLTTRWEHALRLSLIVLVAAGALLRLVDLLRARSLWADEAMLALNAVGHAPLRILLHHDLLQVAPPMFIWLQQLSVSLLGVSEVALRLAPALAGILACFLAWPVARRFTGRPAAVIVVGLISLSATLVAYSTEAKPYSVDVLASLLLLWLTLRVHEQPRSPSRSALLAGFLGLGPFLSIPVAFMGAGAVAALWVVTRREDRAVRRVVLLALAWLAGSLGSLLLQQDPVTKAAMAEYWQGTFLDFGDPRFAWDFWNELAFTALLGGARLTTADVIERISGAITLLLCGAGMIRLVRRDPSLALALAVPLAAAAAVSAAGYYPLSLRLWLWAVPLVMLMLVAGIVAVVERLPVRAPALLFAAAALLCLPSARRDFYYLRNPPAGPEDAKSVVARLLERAGEEDTVYVPARSASAWLFYAFPWSGGDMSESGWLHRYMRLASPGGPSFIGGRTPVSLEPDAEAVLDAAPPDGTILGVASGYLIAPRKGGIEGPDPRWVRTDIERVRTRGRRCTWVFYSHVMTEERKLLSDGFAAIGAAPVDSIKSVGAAAVRYC